MNIKEVLEAAEKAFPDRKFYEREDGTKYQSSHFSYTIPGTNMTLYMTPVSRRISARKEHYRYTFYVDHVRVKKEIFAAALQDIA